MSQCDHQDHRFRNATDTLTGKRNGCQCERIEEALEATRKIFLELIRTEGIYVATAKTARPCICGEPLARGIHSLDSPCYQET
jgi:hypothetical protein